jgi:transcriptional regulator with XRE-family HTH domain
MAVAKGRGGWLMSIGERLKQARKQRHLKQVQVAKLTGINNKTLSGYENGVSEPDYETLKILSELYEISLDFIISGGNRSQLTMMPLSDAWELGITTEVETNEIMGRGPVNVSGFSYDLLKLVGDYYIEELDLIKKSDLERGVNRMLQQLVSFVFATQSKELSELIHDPDATYLEKPLTEPDRKLITAYLDVLFNDRLKSNP